MTGTCFALVNLFFLTTAMQARAQEQVYVQSTIINEDRIEPSRTATVITKEQIQSQKLQTVAEVLREVPGIEVVRQGATGQTTSLFIRGARSEDTLVLIDGIEANDALSPSNGFDFSSLSTENISKIEIYRGPQSVRFGAGALGGVIQITTQEGAEKLKNTYSLSAGSYQTTQSAVGTSGAINGVKYSLGIGHLYSKGFSAAGESWGNTEKDSTEVQSASGKVSWKTESLTEVVGSVRYIKNNSDLDNSGGTGGDDPNNFSTFQQLTTGLKASRRSFEDRLKSTFGIYFSEFDRRSQNQPDSNSTTDSTNSFLSENKKIQFDNEFLIGEEHTLLFGLQWRDESGLSNSLTNGARLDVPRKNQSTVGESFTYLFEGSHWFYDLGFRSDQSSSVGTLLNSRASLGNKIDSNTKLYLTYGTGFKLPSLYQLYSSYGDPNTRAEKSYSYELTIEKKIDSSLQLQATGFDNHYLDMIDFNSATNKYFNISKAKSQGVELLAQAKLAQDLKLELSTTYLVASDEVTNLDLLRRPKNSWSASLKHVRDRFESYLQYRYKGDRTDIDPSSFQRKTNPSYEIFNLGGVYKIFEKLSIHARVENMMNKRYEEVLGYGTSGAAIYAGLSGEI